MKRQAGFTLLEILLVVVLMSVAALTVVQTLPESKNNLAKEQASRFFQRLQLLSDDAILNGQDFGIRFDEKKATFTYMQLADEGWQVIQESKYFTETTMEEGLTFTFELGGDAWSASDSLFEQEDFFEDRFEDEDEQPDPPQVFVLSSGELTPFEVSFVSEKHQSIEDTWRVNVTEAGDIQLLAPGEFNEN